MAGSWASNNWLWVSWRSTSGQARSAAHSHVVEQVSASCAALERLQAASAAWVTRTGPRKRFGWGNAKVGFLQRSANAPPSRTLLTRSS